MRIEQVEHGFAGAAQLDALGRADDGPVDEDRMRDHRIKERVIADGGIEQAFSQYALPHHTRRSEENDPHVVYPLL